MSQEQAVKEKEQGNAAYKARDFPTAFAHYRQAWELHKDITYLNNLATAQLEAGDLDDCIATSEDAVEQGRELRADYKLIAKALARTGMAYQRKEDLAQAIRYFNKSLSEHRTPEILAKLKDVEKQKVEAEKQAYINPELSDKARDEGNKAYKAGQFAESVTHYSEAIKRNPSDARGYTNRASAYIKLLALSEALKDSEEAIKVDPQGPKGYIRKGMTYMAMKDHDKAISALQQAEEVDVDKKSSTEIQQTLRKVMQAKFSDMGNESDEQVLQRAMRDPEVQSIMTDPVMQQILQQAQENPKSLSEHMKNPGVAAKIQKLAQAGIIKTR